MFITKMDSCQKQKRERDAFDLYVALKSGQIDFQTLTQLRADDYRVGRSMNALLKYLGEQHEAFD